MGRGWKGQSAWLLQGSIGPNNTRSRRWGFLPSLLIPFTLRITFLNMQIFIKDVKSSNGTFINGDRLSPEGVESEPFELKSEDMIEFGIDIVSEDNKTTLHHKVAAKAYCVFSVDDAGASSRYVSPPPTPSPLLNVRNNKRMLTASTPAFFSLFFLESCLSTIHSIPHDPWVPLARVARTVLPARACLPAT